MIQQRTTDAAVGLVRVHHIHGAVHCEHHPRRDAAVDELQVPPQPLQGGKKAVDELKAK